MENYTISISCTLPSLGKVYEKEVNPHITLRSMTTIEEMKRLAQSDRPLKVLCDIIDDCMVDKAGISSYDMILADYQYLLHRLRVVTYGPQYKTSNICPYCGTTNTDTVNLDDIKVREYNEKEMKDAFDFTLPRSEHKVKLRMQTPRIIDDVNLRVKEFKKKSQGNFVGDPAFLFTLESLIKEVDDNVLNVIELEKFVRSLPMMDTNFIIKKSEQLVEKVGLDLSLNTECTVCGLDYMSSFRVGPEFFGPSID